MYVSSESRSLLRSRWWLLSSKGGVQAPISTNTKNEVGRTVMWLALFNLATSAGVTDAVVFDAASMRSSVFRITSDAFVPHLK